MHFSRLIRLSLLLYLPISSVVAQADDFPFLNLLPQDSVNTLNAQPMSCLPPDLRSASGILAICERGAEVACGSFNAENYERKKNDFDQLREEHKKALLEHVNSEVRRALKISPNESITDFMHGLFRDDARTLYRTKIWHHALESVHLTEGDLKARLELVKRRLVLTIQAHTGLTPVLKNRMILQISATKYLAPDQFNFQMREAYYKLCGETGTEDNVANVGGNIIFCPGLLLGFRSGEGEVSVLDSLTLVLGHEVGHQISASRDRALAQAFSAAVNAGVQADPSVIELNATAVDEKVNQTQKDEATFMRRTMGCKASPVDTFLREISADLWGSYSLADQIKEAKTPEMKLRLLRANLKTDCFGEYYYRSHNTHPKGSTRVNMILHNPELRSALGCPKTMQEDPLWCGLPAHQKTATIK